MNGKAYCVEPFSNTGPRIAKKALHDPVATAQNVFQALYRCSNRPSLLELSGSSRIPPGTFPGRYDLSPCNFGVSMRLPGICEPPNGSVVDVLAIGGWRACQEAQITINSTLEGCLQVAAATGAAGPPAFIAGQCALVSPDGERSA